MTFKEEFRLKNFGFSCVSLERFYISQWRLPGIAYLLYRIVTAVYTLVVLVITANHQFNHHNGDLQHWAAYLTNWTYMMLTLYHVLHALMVFGVLMLCRNGRRPLLRKLDVDEHVGLFNEFHSGRDDLGSSDDLEVAHFSSDVMIYQRPSHWPHNLVWIIFNMASTASFMVTLVFWAILVPNSKNGSLAEINHDNLQLHLVNTIIVLIEVFITALPVRLLHVIYPFCYGLIYLLFSVFYWIDDHSHVMYDILDWGKAGKTVGYIFLVGFVVIPLLHLILYLLHRLKLVIFAYTHHL